MKLTEAQLKKIVDFCDFDFELEKKHRKGCSFHAWGSYEITEEDIGYISETLSVDKIELASLVGTYINTTGTWSEEWGCEWDYYSQSRKVSVIVPEEIIPEHTIVQMESF